MKNEYLYLSIGVLVVIVGILIFILVKNNRKKFLKQSINDLYVRFNEVKTVPLAFKLNKAQAMAKKNDEAISSVQEYYSKYEGVEKHISQVGDMLINVEDDIVSKPYKQALESIKICSENISDIETEIKDIDTFLQDFSRKESEQREFSVSLQQKYRNIKIAIDKNSNLLSISYEGFKNKLKECEDLFSSSEEWMYANDYMAAQDDLDKINVILDSIKINANKAPKLIKDIKGVLPVMLDEFNREYELTRQRGVYVDHLNITKTIEDVNDVTNRCLKEIAVGNCVEIENDIENSKTRLNDIRESLIAENRCFKQAKEDNDKALEHIKDLTNVENYVRIAYDKDSVRFGLENLKPILKKQRQNIEKYKKEYQRISEDINSNSKASSLILDEVDALNKEIEVDKKNMYSYKTFIDKSTDGEARANNQLIKLQLVISEVEAKIAEYHLPTISSSYSADLSKSRGYIASIRKALKEIPINIDELNVQIDEAIDFVYKFYNNVNNIVGMAIMVENAIVFGNRYRSTYSDIDRELSKAEFQYLNGEYTKALKTAITCMESLFPENIDDKILENA